jgi:hypothetical protein
MRSAIIALATALLVSILPTSTSAQTGIGVLDVWLKARESADAPNDQKVTLYTKSKALVIGMDHYSGAWPQLSNGIKDAEEVAKGLMAQGFEVTLKKDLKSEDLDRSLRNFFIVEGDDPNARLFLWFAGHGDTIDSEAYLVPIDAPSSDNDAEFRSKAISLRRFGEYMREAKARHVLAIFDSCFSGSVFNVARSRPSPAITLATTQPVREFISSGEAEQQVSDDGTFRKLFLDALAGKESDADANHDGYVTGTELGLFLQQKMTDLTNNRQTPRYGKLNAYSYDRGDFVFQVTSLPQMSTAASLSENSNIRPETLSNSEATAAWNAVKDTKSIALLEMFIGRYGDSPYGNPARARLDELKTADRGVAEVTPNDPAGVEVAFWNSIQNDKNPQLFEAYLKRYPTGAFADIAKITLEELRTAALKSGPEQADDNKVPISDPGLLREVRERLYELNFDPGPFDGPTTDAAREAIREFEQQNHLALTGTATMGLLRRLREVVGLKPWGAIVYAPSEEKWGMSWDTATRKDAVARARASCEPAKCTTEVSFFGTECGAFAHSGGVWAIVARDNVQRAKEAALSDCGKRGKNCRIVATVCADGAERSSTGN